MEIKSKLKPLLWVIMSVSLILLIVCFVYSKKERIVYINLKTVIDSFNYKQDLEKELNKQRDLLTVSLDSLETEIKITFNQIEKESNKELKAHLVKIHENMITEYNIKKQKVENSINNLTEKLNSQLYQRLNQYVKDYGEQNKYDFIIGTQANGTIMYAKQQLDVSDEIIVFINKKYEGRK